MRPRETKPENRIVLLALMLSLVAGCSIALVTPKASSAGEHPLSLRPAYAVQTIENLQPRS